MSWFARSINNTLKFDDEEDDAIKGIKPEQENLLQDNDVSSPTSPSRGVKEDLSELTKTLKNQFWGVASFLAPPPQLDPNNSEQNQEPDPDGESGIRTDLAEIGGRFRSGISKLSNNINVTEITKMASNFLQLESDDEIGKEGIQCKSFHLQAQGVREMHIYSFKFYLGQAIQRILIRRVKR